MFYYTVGVYVVWSFWLGKDWSFGPGYQICLTLYADNAELICKDGDKKWKLGN